MITARRKEQCLKYFRACKAVHQGLQDPVMRTRSAESPCLLVTCKSNLQCCLLCSEMLKFTVLFYRKLLLHLPYRVDSRNGKARFLSEEETLEVTLRVSREFDFINFA